jgi:hypothetical protein
LTDIRKIKIYIVFVSHTRTLIALGDAKGATPLRDEGLLEVELKGESKQGEDNEGTGEATPKFEAMVKLPGQSLSDRTLVKLVKHPTPTAPEPTPPTARTNPAETAADYLNRVYKLEFDLSKSEPESNAASDDFQTMKRPDSNEYADEAVVYFTVLNLNRKQAIELILKLKNEMKHNQTEIIWMLWNARPGKTKAYETAVSEYKELLALGFGK